MGFLFWKYRRDRSFLFFYTLIGLPIISYLFKYGLIKILHCDVTLLLSRSMTMCFTVLLFLEYPYNRFSLVYSFLYIRFYNNIGFDSGEVLNRDLLDLGLH